MPELTPWGWPTMSEADERRYQDWCRVNGLDPQDTQTMIAYEKEHDDEDNDAHRPD